MEVGVLPRKFLWKLEEVDVLPWTFVESFMEVHGSFHCRWKGKLPLLPSVAAATNIFRGSFHELPYTPTYLTYFHEYDKPPAASTKLTLTLTLTLSWSCFYGSWPTSNLGTMEVDGSTWKECVASMEDGAACIEARLIPTCMEVNLLQWK